MSAPRGIKALLFLTELSVCFSSTKQRRWTHSCLILTSGQFFSFLLLPFWGRCIEKCLWLHFKNRQLPSYIPNLDISREFNLHTISIWSSQHITFQTKLLLSLCECALPEVCPISTKSSNPNLSVAQVQTLKTSLTPFSLMSHLQSTAICQLDFRSKSWIQAYLNNSTAVPSSKLPSSLS